MPKFTVTTVSGRELEDFLNGLRDTYYLDIFPNTTLNDYFYVVHAVLEAEAPVPPPATQQPGKSKKK